MKTKEKRTRINSVHYHYVGTDQQFETFVKNVVRDYITCNSVLPDTDDHQRQLKNLHNNITKGVFYDESMAVLSALARRGRGAEFTK